MEDTQVAEMVQTLALEPGMRVLEIGARGAYHRGLLASYVGECGRVTTIDLHTEITHPLLSPFQSVRVGDAEDVFSNNPTRACYDRIISTQGVQYIPFGWIDLLAPGGRVIVELRRPLAAVVLLLYKHDDGKGAGGAIMPIESSFRNPRSLNPPRNPGPMLCEIQDAV
ncbi:MAG TPA: hypothetical protein VKR06_46720, partial [Ktedonosporobacter sp.]|nr:hypothetical protein [Ktedonosporobacter sp.]